VSGRRGIAGAALGLAAMLLLSGCETTTVENSTEPLSDTGVSPGDAAAQVPEPSGNQLSHEEMREQLQARYPEATLSDTSDYWAGLQDIETELQRLVVDPPECKQFVVRSATPVPAGALVAFADTSGGSAGEDAAGEDREPEGSGDSAGESSEADPEASSDDVASDSMIRLASTEDEPSEDEGASEDGSGEGSRENSDDGSESEGDSESDSEEEPEPVTVDLPAERQAVVYTFQDWRAADAHFSSEEEGLESCDAYTASRAGDEAAETSTSVDSVDVSTEADAALGITRRISSEGTTEHSAAVILRTGSHIVTVMVPLADSLSEEEAEVAVDELETEAADLLASLD